MKHTQGEVKQNGQNGIHLLDGTCVALTYGNDQTEKPTLIASLPSGTPPMT